MKKPFYLINALILCCFGTLHAQQSSRIIAQSTYHIQSGNLKFGDSSDYKYSFGRGGHPDTSILYDQQTTYTSTAGSPIINNYQYNMSYDHKNNITEYKLNIWNAQTSAWQNMSHVKYTYNPSGFKINDTFSTWDIVNSKWNISTVNHYDNNAAGKVTTQHMLTINTSTKKFDTLGRYITKYNSAGDIEEEITMTLVGGTISNYYKYNYAYNSANLRTTLTTYQWSNNKWVEMSKNENTYTGNQVTKTEGFNWNTTTSQWVGSFRNTFTYNSNGLNTKMSGETYSPTTSTWNNSSEYTYSYNSFRQKNKADISMWDAVNKKWTLYAITTYYYETYNPATISESIIQASKLKLWPVPSNDALNFTWDGTQGYTAIITDMTGRVYTQVQKNAANTREQVDISKLPAGNYTLVLQGEDGGMHKALFNVVR